MTPVCLGLANIVPLECQPDDDSFKIPEKGYQALFDAIKRSIARSPQSEIWMPVLGDLASRFPVVIRQLELSLSNAADSELGLDCVH